MRRLGAKTWFCFFWASVFFSPTLFAQRLVVPPGTDSNPASAASLPPAKPASQEVFGDTALVLKIYPDGTKKIVPLVALNYRDDGAAFGGPPKLSLYPEPAPRSDRLTPASPERLSVAPIGNNGNTATVPASLPASPDSLGGAPALPTAAGDPMSGSPAADPMAGGAAPPDPLSGAANPSAPPLQTVSGKPAPIVGDANTLQLGAWDSFFLNGGIGGSLQGQLTARRVDNGNNRQAYPYQYPAGTFNGAVVGGENFTFNPGFRFDMEFGYNFYEWLGVGLQTGLTYNGLNQYNVTFNTSPGGGLPAGSYNMSADGDLVQVPVQINGILRWPGDVKFRPFLGGGIGAIWQQLDVNNYYLANTDIQGNYCRSGFQFGWNAEVGATYAIEPGLDFYGAFKMLSAFMPVIGNYQFENSYNFAIEVGIQSRF